MNNHLSPSGEFGSHWRQAVLLLAFFVGVLIAPALNPTAHGAEKGLRMTVVPETRHIQQYDPLLIKVQLENQSQGEISLPLPSRAGVTLAVFVELKPQSDAFAPLSEAGEIVGMVLVPEIALKPGQKFVAYEQLFRSVDGDFVFRKSGEYKFYVELRRGRNVVGRSETIAIQVNPREKPLLTKIEEEFELLRTAVHSKEIFLYTPEGDPHLDRRTRAERITVLQGLRRDMKRGHLADSLAWHLELLKIKYGSEDDAALARKQIEKDREKLLSHHSKNIVAADVMSLLLAKLAVEQNDVVRASRELLRVADDSAEKREIQRLIDAKRPPPVVTD